MNLKIVSIIRNVYSNVKSCIKHGNSYSSFSDLIVLSPNTGKIIIICRKVIKSTQNLDMRIIKIIYPLQIENN